MITVLALIAGIILGLILSCIKPLLYDRSIIENGLENWSRRSFRTGQMMDYNRSYTIYKFIFRFNKNYTYIKKEYLEEQ